MPKRRPKRPSPPPEQAPAGSPPPDEAGEPSGAGNPGLPVPDSVVGETRFQSPSGTKYRIIHTNETDSKDEKKPRKGRRGRPGK